MSGTFSSTGCRSEAKSGVRVTLSLSVNSFTSEAKVVEGVERSWSGISGNAAVVSSSPPTKKVVLVRVDGEPGWASRREVAAHGSLLLSLLSRHVHPVRPGVRLLTSELPVLVPGHVQQFAIASVPASIKLEVSADVFFP